MNSQQTAGSISLLRAILLSMLGVALLFLLLAIGIWVYTTEVLKREQTLMSELLPELDVAFQLTAATSGLQSEGQLLFVSRNVEQLQSTRAELDDVLSKTLEIIDTVAMAEPSVQKELRASVDTVEQITERIVNIKQRQFALQQTVETEKQRILEAMGRLERPVQAQIVLLTEQLLEISEQMAVYQLDDGEENGTTLLFTERIRSLESTNLTIQDYLLFAQDLVSLTAVIEKVPLLTDIDTVSANEQTRVVLLSALVSRSIYLNDSVNTDTLLAHLRDLHALLTRDGNLFVLQKEIIAQAQSIESYSDRLRQPIATMLVQTDLLRDETRNAVSSLAKKNLDGMQSYRSILVALSCLVLFLLAAIAYWLVYRKTVLPLVEITQQFDDVGTERFPATAKSYFLKELSTLSSAMMQLDDAHKSMSVKDRQMQTINDDLTRVNLELGQFAHVASHDLQEPLRKLQQFSDLLVEDYGNSLDDDGRFYVASIRNSAKRMSNLIRDTLAFSRAGRAEQKLEAVDLAELVLQLRDEIAVAIEEADGDVEIHPLPIVMANRLGMAQLFMNLMINALKYRQPDKAAKLSIRVLPQTKPHRTSLVIRIQDNGIGIDEKYLERIFQPFERLQSDGVRGTGLGLAICRKVCEAHHWGLDVSSTLDVGSTFDITIPDASLQISHTQDQ